MDIDQVIESARRNGLPYRTAAVGLPAAALARLRLPSGDPLPEDLERWLAFSAHYPELLRAFVPPAWNLTSARAFVEEEVAQVAEELGEGMDFDPALAIELVLRSVPPSAAGVDWIRLDDSASQAWFVALTESLPVLAYEKEEFWVAYPSFVEYLASRLS